MKSSKVFLLFAVIFSVCGSKAWSCDFCSLHIGATPFEFNTTGIRIDTRVAFGNEIFVDGSQVSNDQDSTGRFVTTQVTGFYRFSDKGTFFFIFPYVDRTEGVGDVVLMTI